MSESVRPESALPGEGETDQQIYQRIAAQSDFVELRRRYLRFAVPATVTFMIWYIAYVVCNNWARDFLDIKVIGNVNIALVFGLLQFASTFAIAITYAWHANRRFDPLADKLNSQFDTEVAR